MHAARCFAFVRRSCRLAAALLPAALGLPPEACGAGLRTGWEEGALCRYCQQAFAAAGVRAAATDAELAGPRQYAPDRHVDILHLKLEVTPDFRARRLEGTATLAFRPLAVPLKSLRLDGVDLEVGAVRSSHEVAGFSVGKEEITIVFAAPLPANADAWVAIDYRAEPSQGFYFRTREMGFPAGDEHCWTQGEPEEARHWFPCFDAPNERSTTEIVCHAPSDMTVLSNGRLLSEETNPATGLKRTHWLQSQPHVNYLVCLVAGRLASLENRHGKTPLRFFTQPSLAEHAANSFQDTAAIMAFFEQETGTPYPWDKYDQTTIADFMWGGMENTTLTTLTQRTLFSAATENVYQSRRLDAHELAHQWFGNYVTCKDWSCLWLNEGFATFYTHLYEGRKFGRDAFLYGLYEDARDEVLKHKDDRRPMVFRGYRSPREQFDFRAYPKGSWVLHMLREEVGEDLFRQGIAAYLRRHALSAVESDDLRETFEDLTGKTLDRFFDQWAYRGGHPRLKVRYRWLAEEGLAHVTIEQQGSADASAPLFALATEIEFALAEPDPPNARGDAPVRYAATSRTVAVDERKHEFFFPLPREPRIVRFDPRLRVLAEVDFEQTDAMLFAQLQRPEDAMGRVLACEALAQRKTGRSVAALRAALDGDAFYGVRETAAKALRTIGDEEAVDALLASRTQADARVRLCVVEQLGKIYRTRVRDALLETARKEPNPAIRAAALRGLGAYQDAEVVAVLRATLDDRSFRDEPFQAASHAIGQIPAAELREPLMERLAARRDALAPEAVAAGLQGVAKSARTRRARDATYPFLAAYLEHPRMQLRIEAARALGELGDERARPVLAELAGREDREERLADAARAALEQLDRRATVAPEEVRQLREEVRELRAAHDRNRATVERLEKQQAAFEAGGGDRD